MSVDQFDKSFETLTGNVPFPWQRSLFNEFTRGVFPASCNLPSGLGKTSVIPIWLLALASSSPGAIPRRLVYVVNRRTVVDQATEEAKRIRDRIKDLPNCHKILCERCSLPNDPAHASPLAISTLRGQFADNREWSRNPAQAAVIVGTVDMIGSRLLFEGYGSSFRTRPLQAGFLGQDVLLVHDEAHLEPAFQQLLEAIQYEQHQRENADSLTWFKFRVMALTATSRGGEEPFELTAEERTPPDTLPKSLTKPIHHVWQRLAAKKGLRFISSPRAQVPNAMAERALEHKDSGKAILVFARTVDAVNAVRNSLSRSKVEDDQVALLTGTIRGYERDQLANNNAVFVRFLPASSQTSSDGSKPRTVYLICTSAGEVGVDLSADHMVSDLSTLDSMAQRFGRVNRRGEGQAQIDVIYESDPNPKKKDDAFERARWETLSLLQSLPPCQWIADRVEASPQAIGCLMGELTESQRNAAFAPAPEILPVSDILFDAWALTTIKGSLPARPPVGDWLHGVSEREPQETFVAWRNEVDLDLFTAKDEGERHRREEVITALLSEFPLIPHELLRDRTTRVHEALAVLARERGDAPAWVIQPDESVQITTLSVLAEKDKKGFVVPLGGRTVVLSARAKGLSTGGTLDGGAAFEPHSSVDYDVAGLPFQQTQQSQQARAAYIRLKSVHSDGQTRYELIARTLGLEEGFEIPPIDDGVDDEEHDQQLIKAFAETAFGAVRIAFRLEPDAAVVDEDLRSDYVILRPVGAKNTVGKPKWPALDRHAMGVSSFAKSICERLKLSRELTSVVTFAAACHDLGKDREVWQRGAENWDRKGIRAKPVAKTLHGRPPENLNGFRHEFASLIDVQSIPEYSDEFAKLSSEMKDIVLHLIAAHHGRARPHFPGRDDADLRTRRANNFVRRVIRPENIDPARPTAVSTFVEGLIPARFARLQRKFGRWGLAYLESLVRAADILDSMRIEAMPVGNREQGSWPKPVPPLSGMTTSITPTAAIRLPMDPCNPGQYFACCGLLEVAHRLWYGAEGWFDGPTFCLRRADEVSKGATSAQGLIEELANCRLTNSMTDAQIDRMAELSALKKSDLAKNPELEAEKKNLDSLRRESPIRLHSPLDLRIDWFLDERAGGSRFKTWAGQQSAIDIAQGMHGPLGQTAWSEIPLDEWLTWSAPVNSLPFYFDSGLSGQGSARDAGFSFDAHGFKMPSRPLLELAAFIGLQRFRPFQVPADNLYQYSLWSTPLLPAAASAAACGAIAIAGTTRFEFRLLYRTKYLKSFLPAQPYRGENP